MSKIRILYLVSLLILGVLLVRGFLWYTVSEQQKYSEVQGESIIQTEHDWILQFDIINREGKETRYSITISVAGEQYNEQFMINNGGIYTYIHHIPRDVIGADKVSLTIYREAEDTPFEQAVYYLN
jgi:hypothetical protein